MPRFLKIKGLSPDDLITGEKIEEIMNSEEMRSYKPARSINVNVEEWSDVVLQVKMFDGCPLVCDQHGRPIIGQCDISLDSKAGGLSKFTASFRSFSAIKGEQSE